MQGFEGCLTSCKSELARKMFISRAIVLMGVALLPWTAFAQEAGGPEFKVEATVRSQLEAFQNENFKGAYGFAHSDVKARFTEVEFEQMVRQQFRAMLDVAGSRYGEVVMNDRAAQLEVIMTDKAGQRSGYRYTLLKDGGEWRIAGVVPFEAPDLLVLL